MNSFFYNIYIYDSHVTTICYSGQQSGETEGGGSPAVSDDDDGGSCSGQSSSTSTSNQKDSKYCDCCYCEFFGHGQVRVAIPTWSNWNGLLQTKDLIYYDHV